MTGKQREILKLVKRTIRNFNRHEEYLIKNDLSERCICSKFATYLERSLSRSTFRQYTVDVEYNRGMGGNDIGIKKIGDHTAFLDLVVHKRGFDPETGYDNLFAIEMKKQTQPFDVDKVRLQILVDNSYGFSYRAGFAIVIIADDIHNTYALKIDEAFYNAEDFE